jgi:hypothetical protein
MRFQPRTVEWASFGLGFALLFSTMRWIMLWSIVSAGWLCASVATLFPDLSVDTIKAMFKLLAFVFIFGSIIVIAQSISWLTRRYVGRRN